MRASSCLDCDIVIINYNAGVSLTTCVASALIQNGGAVIVVDNASSDGSIAAISEMARVEPRLRIIRNERNLGFAKACNVGLRDAAGHYILFLNPDAVLEAEILTCMYAVLLSQSDIAMAGGLLLNPDGTEQAGGRRSVPTPLRSLVQVFGLSGLADRWPNLFSGFDLRKQPLPSHPIEVEAISGACMLVKREAIEDVGLWDEGYFLHCEDLDWCMRFRQKGWKIMFVPDAKVVHHKGACSKSRPIFVEWHKHKGMMRFYRKFFRNQYPGVLMWLVAVGVWSRFAVLATYHGVRHLGARLRPARG